MMSRQRPLTVTLEVQQWNAVMALLAEGPYRVAAPLLTEIQRQCMMATAPAANGAAALSEGGQE
jgi:hypothetical protein